MNQPNTSIFRRTGAVGVIIILALVALFCSAHIVPAGHRGVVKLFGSVDNTPLPEGLHVLNPFARVVDFNVRFQSATAQHAEGGTSDLQAVYEDITVNYEFDPSQAPYVYNNFGDDSDIEQRFIVPALYESFKAIQQQGGAEYVALKAVDKWNGELPQTWSGGGMPFLNVLTQPGKAGTNASASADGK